MTISLFSDIFTRRKEIKIEIAGTVGAMDLLFIYYLFFQEANIFIYRLFLANEAFKTALTLKIIT